MFTKTSRTQWFKFNVSSKSDVSFLTTLIAPMQWTNGSGNVKVYNSLGSTITENYDIWGGDRGKNAKLATPKIKSYKKGATTVSGTAKAGTTVKVSYNGKTYSAKVGSNGKYSVKVAKLVAKKTVTVKVK